MSTTHKLNSDKTVAVALDYYWQPMETCPRSVKIQALSTYGVARYDTYNGQPDIVAWAPLPKRREPARAAA